MTIHEQIKDLCTDELTENETWDMNIYGFPDEYNADEINLNENIFNSINGIQIMYQSGFSSHPQHNYNHNNFYAENWYIDISAGNFEGDVISTDDYFDVSNQIPEIEEKIFKNNGDVILNSVNSYPNPNAGIN